MAHYIVEVRDENYQRVGQIDDYMELDLVIRHCQVGTWQLTVMEGTKAADMLSRGRGVVIWNADIGKALISGPVTQTQRYWTNDQHTGPGSIIFSGKSDDYLAYSFVAFPDPTKAVAKPWSEEKNSVCAQNTERDAQNGKPAGTVLDHYARANFGPSALANRRVPQVNWPATVPTFGKNVTVDIRFETIGTAYEKAAEEGDAGYRFIYNSNTGKIDFEVYEVNDHSDSVFFSPELGNLKQYSLQMTAPSCTRAIVAAQGEGKDRYIMQKVNAQAEADWGMVAELFVDRRDIPVSRGKNGVPALVMEDTGEGQTPKPPEGYETLEKALTAMEAAADESLTEGAPKATVQLDPIDVPSCTFGKHYWVGDRVTVYGQDGYKVQELVREVRITQSAGEDSVTPSVSNSSENGPLNIYDQVRNLRKQVNRLNTRY
jgi:hypothetical protein